MTAPVHKTTNGFGQSLDITPIDPIDGKPAAFIGIYNEHDGGQYTTYNVTDLEELAEIVGSLLGAMEAPDIGKTEPAQYVIVREPGFAVGASLYKLTPGKGTNASDDAPEYSHTAQGHIADLRDVCAKLNRAGGAE